MTNSGSRFDAKINYGEKSNVYGSGRSESVRQAAKKVLFLVARPLRGGGGG